MTVACDVCGGVPLVFLDDAAGRHRLCLACLDSWRSDPTMARRKQQPAALAAMSLVPVTIDPAPIAAAAQQHVTGAQPLVDYILAQHITTDEQAAWAAGVIDQLAAQVAGLDGMRDGFDAPAKAMLAHSKACFGAPIKAMNAAIAHLKAGVKGHVDRSRAAAQAAIMASVSPVEVKAALAVACPVPAGLTERESWKWRIVDANAIPREYWVLDTARLDREAREQKQALAVPGIAPVRDTIVVRSS